MFSAVCDCFSSFKLFLDVRVILPSFLLFEEGSNCFLLFSVFSVVFNFMWLFGNVCNILKIVLGCCATRLGCLLC